MPPDRKLENLKNFFSKINDCIKRLEAGENMNSVILQKYVTLFYDFYDLYRLIKVKQHAERYERADVDKDKKLCRKLTEPLKIGEKVLALAERLKKKDAPGNLYKSTTKNISFFTREQVFVVRKFVKTSNTINYHYWVSKEREDKVIDKRFLRQ